MKFILLTKDLATRSQIKEKLGNHTTQYVRNLDELKLNLSDSQFIITDLENSTLPIEVVMEEKNQSSATAEVVALYPHVQVELAKVANQLGVTQLMTRSKFFGWLQTIA